MTPVNKVTNKRLRIFAVVGVGVLGLVIAGIVFASMQGKRNDPYIQLEVTVDQTSQSDNETNGVETTEPEVAKQDAPSLDPETVASVAIEPMNISVSYVKGIDGFEYQVLRRPNGTQYVEFRTEQLKGTKCTDDTGIFASILENPENTESSTLTKTTSVSGTTYGLSLPADNCTSNTPLLSQYQKSFTDAFGLLNKLN
ncbi:MAG: hypothetical protein WAR37_00410 [Candidatus Microsaccharimonas sp.]